MESSQHELFPRQPASVPLPASAPDQIAGGVIHRILARCGNYIPHEELRGLMDEFPLHASRFREQMALNSRNSQ